MSNDDGGPAFPRVPAVGMSLRDWFAGQVLSQIYAQAEAEVRPAFPDFCKSIAATAYGLADAMLEARGK